MSDKGKTVHERAYEIWQSEGEPHGRDRDHWAQAEREFGESAPSEAAPESAPETADDASRAEPAATAEPATAPAKPRPTTRAKRSASTTAPAKAPEGSTGSSPRRRK